MTSQNLRSLMTAALKGGVTSSALLLACSAVAQDTAQSKADSEALEEIVVTGTLIRGIAPPGTNVIAVSQEDVQETGSSTTAQLLQTIPQNGAFNSLQYPSPGGFNFNTSNRPNLRNLPGFTTAGSSPTLVLMDGRRLVGVGVSTTSPDPDVIPPGMLERVEIVPDGGSALYGSDAVAGVMNFITRKRFTGVELDGRYGEADNYHTADANATAGFEWSGGGFLASYNYSEHDSIYGRDRDFVRMPLTNLAGIPFPVTSIKCSTGNVQPLALAPGQPTPVYALPFTTGTGVPNTANQCDDSDVASIYPEESKHSFFVSVSQELGDSSTLDFSGYYTNREADQVIQGNITTAIIGPVGIPIPGVTPSPFLATHRTIPGPVEIQQVSFDFDTSNPSSQNLALETWGIAPTLTTDLGGSWQLRALASYGYSRTEAHTLTATSATALNNAIAAGLFNPYDWASSNPQALAAVNRGETFGLTHQRLLNGRVVADGDLFTLPGGAVKLAAGVEYSREEFEVQKGAIVRGTQDTGFSGLSINGSLIIPAAPPLQTVDLDRNISSAFAELSVPIVGADNRVTGIQELTLSASGRYDDYSDFGDTFNPKFGLTYKPLESVRLRGAWGTSFVAPSLADDENAEITNLNWIQGLAFLLPPAEQQVPNGPYPVPGGSQYVMITLGNVPDIQPQEADTWSVGIDFEPAFAPGLNLSVTYWSIEYEGVISIPPFTNRTIFWRDFGGTAITVAPTQAQIDAVVGVADVVTGVGCAPQPGCVYAILDARKTNLGIFKVDGLDIAVNYSLPTGFGSIDFGINANYELNREQSPVPGAAFIDLLDANATRFRMRSSIGAQIGNLRSQLTWNHTEGYDVSPPVGAIGPGAPPQQTSVDSFDVLNLFFKYDVKGTGILEDLAFTLNVDNVMDDDPPPFEQQQITQFNMGFANGITVGRLIQFGISKAF